MNNRNLENTYVQMLPLFCGTSFDLAALSKENDLFNERAKEILLAQRGIRIDKDILFGFVPSAYFKASCLPTDDGYIVLIFGGLLYYVYQAAFLAASIMDIIAKGNAIPPDLSAEDASTIFEECIQKLLLGHDPIVNIPILSEVRNEVAHKLFFAVIDFVIAHEIAHIVGDHLKLLSAPIGLPFSTYEPSLQNEFEADVIATRMLAEAYKGIYPYSHTYLGSSFLFELIDSYRFYNYSDENYENYISPISLKTHPHSEIRRSHLIVTTHSDGIVASLPSCASAIKAVRMMAGRNSEINPMETCFKLFRKISDESLRDEEITAVETLLGCGNSPKGTVYSNLGAINDWLSADHRRAQGAIALIASAYLQVRAGMFIGAAVSGVHLAVLHLLYKNIYFADPKEANEAKQFSLVVENCIPAFHELLINAIQVLNLNDSVDR